MAPKKIILACLLALLIPFSSYAEDRYGTWGEIAITKSLPRDFSLGLELESRLQYEQRHAIGLNVGYKASKYFKLGASYVYMYRQKVNDKDRYRTIAGQDYWYGYNYSNYWSSRHRVSFHMTGSYKLWKWLKISLRERYQYTHIPSADYTHTKYRYDLESDSEGNISLGELSTVEEESRYKPAMDKHILRSRLKLAVDKKHLDVSPFVSVETHNNLGEKMNLEKVRTMAGMGYKISKQHEISLAYVLTAYIYDDESGDKVRLHERIHALSIGYEFNF